MSRARDISRLSVDGAGIIPFDDATDFDDGTMGKRLAGTKHLQPASADVPAVLLAAASATGAGDYWGDAFRKTVLDSAGFATTGLTLTRAQALEGDHRHGTVITLAAGSNTSVITVEASPDTDPAQQSDISHATVKNVMISAFGGGQSGTSHGIHFPATSWAFATRYSVGGVVEDVYVNAAKNDGLYIGDNRNFSFIAGVIIRYSGADAALIRSYDNRLTNTEFGNSTAGGINLQAGGGNFFSNVSSYFHATFGLAISAFVNQPNIWLGGCFDYCGQHGAYIDGGSQPQMSNGIIGARFQGGSRTASGSWPDVQCVNTPTPPTFIGNLHTKGGASVPSHLYFLTNSTDYAHTVAASFSVASGQKPWSVGFSNRPNNCIVAGNQSIRLAYDDVQAESLAFFAGTSRLLSLSASNLSASLPLGLAPYTVGTLPTPGTGGRAAYCSNARVFNGAGAQEGVGAGTGTIVVDSGSAWRLAGTNVTAAA